MKVACYLASASIAMSCSCSAQTLHLYGPGGPLAVMKECAAVYQKSSGLEVVVEGGPEKEWFPAAQRDADLIFGGADYMLTQFALDHEGFLRKGSRVELYDRAMGILVRPGNPKAIRSLSDLTGPGVRILDVNGAGQVGAWEDLIGRLHLIAEFQRNIALSVPSTADGVKAWDAHPELDAWITYESWVKRLPTTTALVRLPEDERLYRGTPIAVAERSTHSEQAAAFIKFLQSPQAHAIFVKWGWR
jgi:accessory colonization factor AcfC